MRKKLWLVDLTLLGLIVFAASAVRDRWMAAESREQALLRRIIAPVPAPAIPALATVGPVTAASYIEVAQQFLFSRDRNSTIIIDPPAPPPPPPPMPALPLAYGVIDIGTGPTVILVEKPGAPHKGYRVGETIGAFKIIALSSRDITFEWEGKPVKKTIEELTDKRAMQQPAPPPANAPAAAAPAASGQVTSLAPVKAGPGVELGEKSRACVPGDTTPAGTVQDGFRKVTNKTPFGESCRWEAVQ